MVSVSLDDATREKALKELIALNTQWYESGGIQGKPLSLARLDLRGVDFSGADLTKAIFRRARCNQSNFDAVDFHRAKLTEAVISWEQLKTVTLDSNPKRGLSR